MAKHLHVHLHRRARDASNPKLDAILKTIRNGRMSKKEVEALLVSKGVRRDSADWNEAMGEYVSYGTGDAKDADPFYEADMAARKGWSKSQFEQYVQRTFRNLQPEEVESVVEYFVKQLQQEHSTPHP